MKRATSNQIEFNDYFDELGIETVRGMHVEHCFSRHTHRFCCVGIVGRGAWELSCRGQSYDIRPGRIFIIPPGIEHSCRSIGEDVLTYWTMVVSPAAFSAIGLEHTDVRALQCLLAQTVIDDSRLYRQIAELPSLLSGNEPQIAKQSAVLSILGDIVAQYTTDAVKAEANIHHGNHESQIRRVQRYIEENYPESISLQSLAELADSSPYHLLRLFSDIVGIPPHVYQQQIRLRSAKQRLSEGGSIADAALETGFADQSHFSKTFKKMVGITPKEYQRQKTETEIHALR